MKTYISKILPNLKRYSKSLDKKAILIDQPWVHVNEEGALAKYIFRSNGELIISEKGKVKSGNWEYISGANSLLIRKDSAQYLLNQDFTDEALLALKYDGVQADSFILANENLIPDLDVPKYLNELFYRKKSLRKIKVNGETYGVDTLGVSVGSILFRDCKRVDLPILTKDNRKLYLEHGRVRKISSFIKINYKDAYYHIECFHRGILNRSYPKKGDLAFNSNKNPLPDGKYKLARFRSVKVKDGVVN